MLVLKIACLQNNLWDRIYFISIIFNLQAFKNPNYKYMVIASNY